MTRWRLTGNSVGVRVKQDTNIDSVMFSPSHQVTDIEPELFEEPKLVTCALVMHMYSVSCL